MAADSELEQAAAELVERVTAYIVCHSFYNWSKMAHASKHLKTILDKKARSKKQTN